MDDNGRRVLEMLSQGKITVDEAERLVALVEEKEEADASPPTPRTRNGPGKYLCIVGEDGDERFNIRVPLSLIRGGVKASTLFSGKMGERLREKGIDLDHIGGDGGLDDLIDGLGELEMEFGSGRGLRRAGSASTPSSFCISPRT